MLQLPNQKLLKLDELKSARTLPNTCVSQIGKPCRECYLKLAATRNKLHNKQGTNNTDNKEDVKIPAKNVEVGTVLQLTDSADDLGAEDV